MAKRIGKVKEVKQTRFEDTILEYFLQDKVIELFDLILLVLKSERLNKREMQKYQGVIKWARNKMDENRIVARLLKVVNSIEEEVNISEREANLFEGDS